MPSGITGHAPACLNETKPPFWGCLILVLDPEGKTIVVVRKSWVLCKWSYEDHVGASCWLLEEETMVTVKKRLGPCLSEHLIFADNAI
jgi:hypothetical protein